MEGTRPRHPMRKERLTVIRRERRDDGSAMRHDSSRNELMTV